MTDNETATVEATIRNLWPRVKWGPGEWSVLAESCHRIDIDAEQAIAAIRNVKATSDKYPTVAAMLVALRKAENRPAVGPASPLPDTMSRVNELRKRLSVDGVVLTINTPASVVLTYWRLACARSMRMRADIPKSYETDFRSDAGEVAQMSPSEADEWWSWLVEQVYDVPLDLGLSRFAARNGRMSVERAAQLLGKEWDARPKADRNARQRTCNDLANLAGGAK